MTDKPELPASLQKHPADWLPRLFGGMASPIPVLGPLIEAAGDFLLPTREDRIVLFIAELQRQLQSLRADYEALVLDVRAGSAPEKARLIEEAIHAVSNASDLKRQNVVALTAHGLMGSEAEARADRRILEAIGNLDDDQLLFLRDKGEVGWITISGKQHRAGYQPELLEWSDPDFQLMIAGLRWYGLVEIFDAVESYQTPAGFVIWLTTAGAAIRSRIFPTTGNPR